MEPPSDATGAETPHEQGVYPCTATIEGVVQLFKDTSQKGIPIEGDVWFATPWVALGNVSIEGGTHGLGVSIAGIQGPCNAMHARHTSAVQRFLAGKSLAFDIHHHDFPYYCYGDISITDPTTNDVTYLSDLLLDQGLARVSSHSERLDSLVANPKGGMWQQVWGVEPTITVTGTVCDVLAGDVVELSPYTIEERSVPTVRCPLGEWHRGVVAERPARLRVLLENIRAPRHSGSDHQPFALEVSDVTHRLVSSQQVTVVVTSAWHGIESIGEVRGELHDSPHVRGSLYLHAWGDVRRTIDRALADATPEARRLCTEYVESEQAAGRAASLAVILASLSTVVDGVDGVDGAEQTSWVELLPPADFMCPITPDHTQCLRMARDAGVLRYERDLLKYKTYNSKIVRKRVGMKWVYNRAHLVNPGSAGHDAVVEEIREVAVEGKRVIRATVEIRKNYLNLGSKPPSPPVADESNKKADDKIPENVDDKICLDEMVVVDEAREMVVEEEKEAHSTENLTDVQHYFSVDVILVSTEKAGSADPSNWASDAQRATEEPVTQSASARGLDAKVSLLYFTTVEGRQCFFGHVSVQRVTDDAPIPLTAFPRQKSWSCFAEGFKGLLTGGHAHEKLLGHMRKRGVDSLTLEKSLRHVRMVHPALDSVSVKYLAFQPRIPNAAKTRLYRTDKPIKNYPESIPTTLDGIPKLMECQLERLPLHAGISSLNPLMWPPGLGSEVQRIESVEKPEEVGTPVLLFSKSEVLRQLCQFFMFNRTKKDEMYLMVTRSKGTEQSNVFAVNHLNSLQRFLDMTPEILAKRDAASFDDTTGCRMAFRFSHLHRILAFHHSSQPPWKEDFAEKEIDHDDPIHELPLYTLKGTRIISPGCPLFFKSSHEDDADRMDVDGEGGEGLYLHHCHGLEWGPAFMKRVKMGGISRVAAMYKSGGSRSRMTLRIYGCLKEKESPFLEKCRRRNIPVRLLLAALQERAKGLPVKGAIFQVFTKPHDRITAVYAYAMVHLAMCLLQALPEEVRSAWKPAKPEQIPQKMDELHGLLVDNVQTVLSKAIGDSNPDYLVVRLTWTPADRVVEWERWHIDSEKELCNLRSGLFSSAADQCDQCKFDTSLRMERPEE
eukprot:TRINITY_DN23155_c1_g1_i1.p1 TRINITY_DN23155_c1_g1~~TRINITY_DN23155_c1_g1_i1.p1  ORF type:complete len:1131 (+),score=344.84 TRINITY_DN23155_c1_g1_i1:35-3394(+)